MFFCGLLAEQEARTSTPKRARCLLEKFNDAKVGEAEHRGGKHDLTPTSKIREFSHVFGPLERQLKFDHY